jgi:hypothetical protein
VKHVKSSFPENTYDEVTLNTSDIPKTNNINQNNGTMVIEFISSFDYVIELQNEDCGFQFPYLFHKDENECLVDFIEFPFSDIDIP